MSVRNWTWFTMGGNLSSLVSVFGGVKNFKRQGELDNLQRTFGKQLNKVRLFDVNPQDRLSVYKFVWGCDYVITGVEESPLTILKAAQSFNVRKVVLTSSIDTVQKRNSNKTIYTEDDFAEIGDALDTECSKLIKHENEAREFYNKFKEAEKPFALTTLHSGSVIGPVLSKAYTNYSTAILLQLLSGEKRKLPRFTAWYTDVRDLAEMHYNAITKVDN